MQDPIEGKFRVKGEKPDPIPLLREDPADPHRRAPIDYWIAAIAFFFVVMLAKPWLNDITRHVLAWFGR